MSYRTRNIAIASGLALLAVIFMIVYLSKKDGKGASDVGKGLVSVLFAARDIPQGTPGSSLQSGALVEKRVPSNTLVSGAISKPAQIRGTVATQSIIEGQQISSRGFGPIAASGVLAHIAGGYRIIQISGDKNQTLNGTLKAGNHVDVFATWQVKQSCDSCRVSGVIIRNALVLGTSTELGSGSSGQEPVQLRLTGGEAERLFWITKNGDWWLVLRPVVKPHNAKGYATALTILNSLKRAGANR